MAAQGSPGQKAVWGVVNHNNTVVGSTVWVDASAWWRGTSTPDLCLLIQQNILESSTFYSQNYPNGTVIDARGLVYPGQMTACSVDPFGLLSTPPPSTTLLLPSGYITVSVPWTVPNNTRIIGDEQGSRLRAVSNFSYMIEMGGSNTNGDLCPSGGCTSVGLEHLTLDGSVATVGGIDNKYSQAGSYINDINLYNLSLTGLYVGTGAANSGPYTNVSYLATGSCGSSGCVCIDLEAQTQGVHGVTCNGNNVTGALGGGTGIYVNASNNSLEDIHIEAFWDGIDVGNTTRPVANVMLSNITGVTTGNINNGYTTNLVHLCGANSWNPTLYDKCANTTAAVSDITILQATNDSAPYTINSTTVQPTIVTDDVTKNVINVCHSGGVGCATLPGTAIYALGEPDAVTSTNYAYTKFASSPATAATSGNYPTTSSYVPTWGVGTITPPGPPNPALCSPVGAIYSLTSASGAPSVYVCNPSGIWHTIP